MVSEDKVALALSKRKQETREERAERIKQQNQFEYDSKMSHDWHFELQIDRIAGKGRNIISHCKKCGLIYFNFKYNPSMCPSKDQT